MATEHRLSYTATEVDDKLRAVGQLLEDLEDVEVRIGEIEENIDVYSNINLYDTLSTAITDLNNGVTTNAVSDASTAKVSVGKADNGMTTVTLLDNITESALIEVNKDINLVLNGYTLNFNNTNGYLSFLENTKCVISGEVSGSAITHTSNTVTTLSQLIKTSGAKLTVRGGLYSVASKTKNTLVFNHRMNSIEIFDASIRLETSTVDASAIAYAIQGAATAHDLYLENSSVVSRGGRLNDAIMAHTDVKVVVKSCDISATAVCDESVVNGHSQGIYLHDRASLNITDSTVFADAPGDNADESAATGIINAGTVFCKNTNVTGTLAGISNNGALYVSGGIFTGYSHGGFYLSDCTTEGVESAAYINDATIRCGNYTGEFTDIFAGDTVEILGGMYIGSGSNITAYLDGCSINDDNAGEWGLVVRASGSETNNHLNISNSTIGGYCRVDSDAVELNLGHGVTLLKGAAHPDATYASYITYTNEVYRKRHPDEQLNGNDYGALVKTVKAEPKMELIHSATIPEEGLAYIDLTTYKLDAVTLTINSPATDTRGTARLQVYYNGSLFYRGSDVAASDNQNRAYSQTQDIWKVNGAWRCESTYQVTGWGVAKYTNIQGKVMLESDYPYIDRVIVYFASMPVGADIKIYGVRRNEN